MLNCPCGSLKSYSSCCEPILSGKQSPATPEALMRSRYTAYSMANIDYIKETMRGKALISFQAMEAKRWAKRVIWIKLNVLKSLLVNESAACVEFEASFVEGCRLKVIHESSEFKHEANRWYYVSGTLLPSGQTETIIYRNTPCPCGSQRKFKNCHGYKLVL